MIVKVILEKSKVVKDLKGQRGQTSSLLFIINQFRSFLFLGRIHIYRRRKR